MQGVQRGVEGGRDAEGPGEGSVAATGLVCARTHVEMLSCDTCTSARKRKLGCFSN